VNALFRRNRPAALIGVLHLLPLPGAPSRSLGIEAVSARACADARALLEGGATAAILENLGDAPFTGGSVDAYTIAAMTCVAVAVRQAVPALPLGINVLRNDARAALSIAAAVGAAFIRVNVHTGAMVTDQGLVTGDARGTLLERNRLGASVSIAADVLVKHAVPLGNPTLIQSARDALHRGRADALIITGPGTGLPVAVADLEAVREALPNASLWSGSGTTPELAETMRHLIDAAVVGTWLHEDSELERPVSAVRVRAVRAALGS
jgi:membrane complex biogenesis BtpA family protein